MTGWKLALLSGVLAVSLLGNALAIGAAVRLYHMRQALLGDTASVTLPRAERRELLSALTSHAADMKPGLQAVQAARAAAVQAIVAKPFDAAKAGAAFDTLRTAVDGLMQQGQTVVLQDLTRRAGD